MALKCQQLIPQFSTLIHWAQQFLFPCSHRTRTGRNMTGFAWELSRSEYRILSFPSALCLPKLRTLTTRPTPCLCCILRCKSALLSYSEPGSICPSIWLSSTSWAPMSLLSQPSKAGTIGIYTTFSSTASCYHLSLWCELIYNDF